jgi:hypothetical protein
MDIKLIKQIIKSKTFRLLVILAIFYFLGFLLFLFYVEPNRIKQNSWSSPTDIIYVIYWRWYLDWLMMFGFLLEFVITTIIFSLLKKKIKKSTLNTYILPIVLMLLNYLGMVAIDIAVTYFADFYINGTWFSTEIIFLDMNAQRLYHGFFFWFMPALIVIGIPLSNFINHDKNRLYVSSKSLCAFIGLFFLTLGFIDPIVCYYVWGDALILGEWNMMGYGWIWGTGWITHYIINCILWFIGIFFINRLFKEISSNQNDQKEINNLDTK